MGKLNRRLERLEQRAPGPRCTVCRDVHPIVTIDETIEPRPEMPVPCPACGQRSFVIEVVNPYSDLASPELKQRMAELDAERG